MRIVSGLQSSGSLHLGNWFGAVRQLVRLQDSGEAFDFIADLQALTTVHDGRAGYKCHPRADGVRRGT